MHFTKLPLTGLLGAEQKTTCPHPTDLDCIFGKFAWCPLSIAVHSELAQNMRPIMIPNKAFFFARIQGFQPLKIFLATCLFIQWLGWKTAFAGPGYFSHCLARRPSVLASKTINKWVQQGWCKNSMDAMTVKPFYLRQCCPVSLCHPSAATTISTAR